MDHNRAAETQAVERYLLGEMPSPERDDFEEHYFTCEVCSQEIRAASRFQAAARQVLKEPERIDATPRKERVPWWRMPAFAPMAAAILLVSVVAVYQAGFEIPSLKKQLAARVPLVAESVTTIALEGVSRGATPEKIARIPRTTAHVRLSFDTMLQESPVSYECTIADSHRTLTVQTLEPTKPGALPEVDLYPQSLPPGQYTITLKAVPAPTTPKIIPQEYNFEII